MFIELKRCNSVGNIDGLLFLISIIEGKERVSRDEIRNRCALENGITINCPGAIAFLEYLCLVEVKGGFVSPAESLNAMIGLKKDEKINKLITLTINKLIEDGIFDKDATGFDAEKGHLTIKRSAFPLAYAAIRNFLISVNALDKDENGVISVPENYEDYWTSKLRSRRRKFTLEQLLRKKEEQSKRGLEAEEFVLKLEKKRLPSKSEMIKRISDFDVTAGYDLVSFKTEDSQNYDRFIEVKCYLGVERFFWSENESDVARIKGDKYILCLVDYEQIGKPGYLPEYIYNPYEVIFNNDQWMVNTASYRIQKI